ncbi:MAG TPA: Ni/Fe-hydrogenase, b-type cytochrome subunit [Candidatus Limnocylindrales bacterium]|nr:Ni/Fe-hydrogenase, b-type cytochrome subunit [Candidatus Limnocylindrales bacterium]
MTATPLLQERPAGPAAMEAAPAGHGEERVRLYVWQRPVRITHWVTAGCIAVLALTGGYIADPFLIPPGGSVMTTMRFIHIVAAFTLLASGLIRTVWLLVGNRFARWNAFIPTTRFQATEVFRQAGFYAFLRKEIPKVIGHNQLAAVAYLVLFVLLVVETVTGMTLDGAAGAEPARTMFGWLGEAFGLQWIRLVHHLAMWAILAIALFHVYSCVLIDNIEKNGLLSSMVGGFKFPTRDEVLEARDGGPELLETLE